MDNKIAANNLVSIIKEIVQQEQSSLDTTILGRIVEANFDGTFNVYVEPDEVAVIKSLPSIVTAPLNVGDYVYIYKIKNQLNNSFILKKINDTNILKSDIETSILELQNQITNVDNQVNNTGGGTTIINNTYNSRKEIYNDNNVNLYAHEEDDIWLHSSTLYSVTANLTNCNLSNSQSVEEGQPYSATVTPNTDYTISSIVVTMGGVEVTAVTGNSIYIANVTGNLVITATAELIVEPYITFSSQASFTLNTYNTSKNWDGTLEYSTDTINWSTWSGASISSAISSGTYKLYVRGTGNSYINTASIGANGRWVLTGSNISCSGNINNLLDYSTVSLGGQPTMANFCYYYMFLGCTSLTSAPSLPATTLTNYCYEYMFSGCTSLTSAPSLPATILAADCCYCMFNGCTSLTSAPSLPATTLALRCYQYMFNGCTSLTSVPSLPATTLAGACYYSMFKGCSLIKLSTTQDTTYVNEYRIPTTDTGTDADNSITNMFTSTGGTFTGTPTINTTYYTSNTLV